MKINWLEQRIRAATWQNWMSQWAELIQSGMPVLDALALSTELQQANRQSRELQTRLNRTSQFLQQGQSLQTAFRAACRALPLPLEVALLCAQANGDLGAALQEQLQRWKTTSEASHALARSLIYPGVVLILAVACWIFLDQVTSPHTAVNNKPTKSSSNLPEILMLAGVALLVVAAIGRASKAKSGSREHYWSPEKAWIASNFYHVIACELQAGIDLMHCLRYRVMPGQSWLGMIMQNSRTSLGLNQFVAKIQTNLRQGMNLSQAMQNAQAPGFLIRQSQLAEQTGNLAYCFFLAAKVYEMQAIEAQRKLQSIVPPAALAIAALTLAMAYQFTLAPLYNNLTGLS